jgi:glycosyltransferase involved in cell wall biosynthesis
VKRTLSTDRNDEIAFVARFDIKQKRQDVMIDAFAIVTKQYPQLKLVFYGDGEPDIDIIKKSVVDYGLTDKVIFKGVVNDVIENIKNSKLYVLSSDYEGLPNSLIEAMVAGLTVVSTDCSPGGARELINNGQNGLITPCGDAEKLAKAIIYVLDNPEEAEQMGKEAQKIANISNPNVIFSKWEKYIDSFLFTNDSEIKRNNNIKY